MGQHGFWGKFNLSNVLVVLEIALALILLVGAGLLVRSFSAIQHVYPGFTSDNVLTFRVRLFGDTYDDDARAVDFFEMLEDRLTSLGDVRAVGGTHILPFAPGATWGRLQAEGAEQDPELIAHYRVASPAYFDAMRIPLLQGRTFNRSDRSDSKGVVVVEQQLADRLFPGQDPIGRRIEGWSTDWAEIVGVVGSVKISALEEDPPIMAYYPYAQNAIGQMYYAIRSTIPTGDMARYVETTIHELDPNVLLADLTPMNNRVETSLASRRFAMLIFQLFAFTAMILAAVGIYGLVAYRVNLGTRELGMRMALGARQRDIVTMVVRHGMALALAGIVIGAGVSLAVTRLMSSMLFNIAPTDVATFLAVVVFLGLVSLAACLIPAGRAAFVDPLLSLRGD